MHDMSTTEIVQRVNPVDSPDVSSPDAMARANTTSQARHFGEMAACTVNSNFQAGHYRLREWFAAKSGSSTPHVNDQCLLNRVCACLGSKGCRFRMAFSWMALRPV